MKILIFALVIIGTQGVSFFDLVQEQWKAYKLTHEKQYQNPTEEKYRMKIFMENSHHIAKHNQLFEQGLVTYKLKLNKWADMLHHEFIHTVNGFNKNILLGAGEFNDTGVTFIPPANVKLADSVDWRDQGAVTPVKDQGHCGSCWSFSATGSLEGQHFRKTGQLTSLSEQNLIDCSTKNGNNGCNGGLMNFAFIYVQQNKGIDTEPSYPYEGENDQCRYVKKNSGATDKGFVNVQYQDEEALKSAVATVGPISVAIDASHESFQFYSEGVYFEPQCSSEELDHGVLAAGYGTDESGQDYWLVKNSWGDTWGDKGYVKMARNKNNHCGIATQASYPLV